jgi:zona occludens toxin
VITLITGSPGAGKTLYLVAEVLPRFAGRKVYVDGVPDLTVEHEVPKGPVDRWHEWIEDGAVLVVDEVQRVWRPRAAGSVVPSGVAAMETHRHRGVDIVLVTQHPQLVDANIRRLVGRHIHVRRVFGWKRAIVYEWDQCSDPARVSTAMKRSWAYPRGAFALYRSASMHHARGQRAPVLVWVVPLAVALAVVLAVGFWGRTGGRWLGGEAAAPSSSGAAKGEAVAGSWGLPPAKDGAAAAAPALSAAGKPVVAAVPPEHRRPYLEAVMPRDPHDPGSAPLYDAVARAVVPPRVVACLATAGRCRCYSQQATPLDLPEDQCRARAAGTWFDPYAPEGGSSRGGDQGEAGAAKGVEGGNGSSNTVNKSQG